MSKSRREFLKTAGASALVAAAVPRTMGAAAFDPFEKSVRELQRAMTAGEITSARLVQFYVSRIAAYDQIGPRVNAVIAINPNAAADARALDAERRRKGPRGPLHGIPILLKDNLDTKDMPTTGGCLALVNHRPTADAFQVRKLRDAGAVILGKVNLHELALGLTTVSSLGGQTLDPYDLTRAPGGSSGGSAVAAAANFAAVTIGTDTSGSIRIPSSHNSVVGLRPSLGLSSRAGVIPFGHTQDTAGPIGRTVEDVAIVLDATAGVDPADETTTAGKGRIPATFTASLRRDALKSARIGMVVEFFGPAPEDRDVNDVARRAIEEMKAQGATIVEITIPDLTAQLRASSLLFQELKAYLGDYLKKSGGPVASVEELLASGLHVAQLQGILDTANGFTDDYLSSDDYRRRLAARATLGQAVIRVMDDNRLDALAYPVTSRIAPLVGGNQAGSHEALSPQTGFPAINVPAGFTAGGFPVGMELLGRPFAESTLIGLAYAFEQATHHRRTPMFERAAAPAQATPGADAVAFDVVVSGAFTSTARFRFDSRTRTLGYDITLPAASLNEPGGIYLHQRVKRANGGVAHILAKSLTARVSGLVTLSEGEASDLKAGKLYVSIVSHKSARVLARGDLKTV